MALRFVAIDPETQNGGSPTVWVDEDVKEIVIQGWAAGPQLRERISATLGRGEDVVRIAARLSPMLRQACEEADRFGAVGSEAQDGGALGVWVDAQAREIVIQGWAAGPELRERVTATPAPNHLAGIPRGEDVVRLPARLIPTLRRACDEADRLG
ncbi:hypothetical protein [Streptacidiphilus sp. EB129]|uniref:hypothetical protein n=1 Tax=Streptacidiphilus sp. EB129 TaxID=3156262 RepID=UPI0035166BFA